LQQSPRLFEAAQITSAGFPEKAAPPEGRRGILRYHMPDFRYYMPDFIMLIFCAFM
jgi:hypothetical protein